jgi:Zn-dependent protease with chaperone function
LAQTPKRDPARESQIESQLQAIAPNAVPTFRAATVAMDKNDNAEAARLFHDVVEQAPQFSPAVRRLGRSLVESGQREIGFKRLEQALQLERSPENLASLAQALASPVKGQQPSTPVMERAYSLAKEAAAKARNQADVSYLVQLAELALRMQRTKEYREAVDELEARFPDEMATAYFSALRAALDGEWIKAEDQIKEAQKRGLPAEAVNAFLNSGVHRQALIRRGIRYAAYLLGLWATGLLLLFLIGKQLSRQTLHSITNAGTIENSTPAELRLRRIYRALIVFAGSYYYVSLPFVIFSVIAATALVVYFFMLIGWLPIGLLLGLGSAALWTVIKCVQTLFIKVPAEHPGRSLSQPEAPGLWALTRQVAEAVKTRPVDDIRITPGTEMAVYEDGSRRERTEDRARRVLVLGMGLLDGLRQAPFCAVLAHEYGHFVHRDTAGGELALRVNNDMRKFAVAMAENGQAAPLNPAWQFLRLYSFLFRRITHGATRLQEILADRVAARQYGARNFEEGLGHVVRRHAEFNLTVSAAFHCAVQAKRPLRDVYGVPVPSSPELQREIDEMLRRESSEDDTHPGPEERFRLVRDIPSTNEATANGLVWDLFADRERLTREMTDGIASRLKEMGHFVPVEVAP